MLADLNHIKSEIEQKKAKLKQLREAKLKRQNYSNITFDQVEKLVDELVGKTQLAQKSVEIQVNSISEVSKPTKIQNVLHFNTKDCISIEPEVHQFNQGVNHV
jgi:TATA-binding protein-associated factor Taf7